MAAMRRLIKTIIAVMAAAPFRLLIQANTECKGLNDTSNTVITGLLALTDQSLAQAVDLDKLTSEVLQPVQEMYPWLATCLAAIDPELPIIIFKANDQYMTCTNARDAFSLDMVQGDNSIRAKFCPWYKGSFAPCINDIIGISLRYAMEYSYGCCDAMEIKLLKSFGKELHDIASTLLTDIEHVICSVKSSTDAGGQVQTESCGISLFNGFYSSISGTSNWLRAIELPTSSVCAAMTGTPFVTTNARTHTFSWLDKNIEPVEVCYDPMREMINRIARFPLIIKMKTQVNGESLALSDLFEEGTCVDGVRLRSWLRDDARFTLTLLNLMDKLDRLLRRPTDSGSISTSRSGFGSHTGTGWNSFSTSGSDLYTDSSSAYEWNFNTGSSVTALRFESASGSDAQSDTSSPETGFTSTSSSDQSTGDLSGSDVGDNYSTDGSTAIVPRFDSASGSDAHGDTSSLDAGFNSSSDQSKGGLVGESDLDSGVVYLDSANSSNSASSSTSTSAESLTGSRDVAYGSQGMAWSGLGSESSTFESAHSSASPSSGVSSGSMSESAGIIDAETDSSSSSTTSRSGTDFELDSSSSGSPSGHSSGSTSGSIDIVNMGTDLGFSSSSGSGLSSPPNLSSSSSSLSSSPDARWGSSTTGSDSEYRSGSQSDSSDIFEAGFDSSSSSGHTLRTSSSSSTTSSSRADIAWDSSSAESSSGTSGRPAATDSDSGGGSNSDGTGLSTRGSWDNAGGYPGSRSDSQGSSDQSTSGSDGQDCGDNAGGGDPGSNNKGSAGLASTDGSDVNNGWFKNCTPTTSGSFSDSDCGGGSDSSGDEHAPSEVDDRSILHTLISELKSFLAILEANLPTMCLHISIGHQDCGYKSIILTPGAVGTPTSTPTQTPSPTPPVAPAVPSLSAVIPTQTPIQTTPTPTPAVSIALTSAVSPSRIILVIAVLLFAWRLTVVGA